MNRPCHSGMAQPIVGDDLHAGDGLLMYWTHQPQSPWQDDRWISEMRRSLRGNQFRRMILNEWVTSEDVFIEMHQWDAIVSTEARPVLLQKNLPVWVAVDASVKHDATAIVAVTYDTAHIPVRLVNHCIFTPSTARPIDFERIVEDTLLDWSHRYKIKSIVYDPYQMVSVAQHLTREGLPMQELPQTVPNLSAISANLYELVTSRNLAVYPDEQMRTAIARAVAVESSRGWKITKEKSAHKIDVVVALAMAALSCVRAHAQPKRRVLFQAEGNARNQLYEVGPGGRLIPADQSRGSILSGRHPNHQCVPGKDTATQAAKAELEKQNRKERHPWPHAS